MPLIWYVQMDQLDGPNIPSTRLGVDALPIQHQAVAQVQSARVRLTIIGSPPQRNSFSYAHIYTNLQSIAFYNVQRRCLPLKIVHHNIFLCSAIFSQITGYRTGGENVVRREPICNIIYAERNCCVYTLCWGQIYMHLPAVIVLCSTTRVLQK